MNATRTAAQLGPRRLGTVYRNDGGVFVVEAVLHGAEARVVLSWSDWAVTVRNRLTGERLTVCSAWDDRNQIVSQPKSAELDLCADDFRSAQAGRDLHPVSLRLVA
ncbi:hypothetical protein [Streptomyces sp. H27-D2]|uniref:hypothetical protein n=1 Tax=Streptomyces sp. H27-D2 TaxID=3046304 RepID=UPI002DB86475|nr:hypothetical protein [Streptomyces sp. H27-D2]MEC4016069.1 hypothetical protein [Streptomyces sp. H27-D2]